MNEYWIIFQKSGYLINPSLATHMYQRPTVYHNHTILNHYTLHGQIQF
jgi:hypothetical protein